MTPDHLIGIWPAGIAASLATVALSVEGEITEALEHAEAVSSLPAQALLTAITLASIWALMRVALAYRSATEAHQQDLRDVIQKNTEAMKGVADQIARCPGKAP